MRYTCLAMTPFLLIVMACTTPPTVSSIDPAEALPGASVKILGSDFVEGAAVDLVLDGEAIPLEAVAVRGAVLIEGVLPADLGTGIYTVNVKYGEAIVSLDDALSVTAPSTEAPCGGEYTANTQLSLARKVIVIDRFPKDKKKERETLRIDFSSVEQIEYELVKLDEEKMCSIVYIRTKNGKRVVFDDDTRVDLKERAFKIGSAVGKKVVITRADADEMGKPMEQD